MAVTTSTTTTTTKTDINVVYNVFHKCVGLTCWLVCLIHSSIGIFILFSVVLIPLFNFLLLFYFISLSCYFFHSFTFCMRACVCYFNSIFLFHFNTQKKKKHTLYRRIPWNTTKICSFFLLSLLFLNKLLHNTFTRFSGSNNCMMWMWWQQDATTNDATTFFSRFFFSC